MESKVGFILLQSCDGCGSHQMIIKLAQKVLLKMAAAEATSQPPPSLPPKPQDFVGVYTAGNVRTYMCICLGWVFPRIHDLC